MAAPNPFSVRPVEPVSRLAWNLTIGSIERPNWMNWFRYTLIAPDALITRMYALTADPTQK
jgi:hypothetical protein